jgi:FkbM family methyltransferase
MLMASPYEGLWRELDEVKTMRRFVKAGDVVFDIGANVGLHSILLSRVVGPSGKVCAFEPNSDLLTALESTISQLRNATLHPIALSNKTTESVLFVPPDDSVASLVDWAVNSPKFADDGPSHVVACVERTLDSLVDAGMLPQPNFIKCDVEGAELRVFEGGRKTLDRVDAPLILFEANECAMRAFDLDVSAAMDFLAGLIKPNYRFFAVGADAKLSGIDEINSDFLNILAVPASRLTEWPELTEIDTRQETSRPDLDDEQSPGASTLVSIVIPAYNVAPYIADTLDSVFAQTSTNYEVIVVNDGSPDTKEFEQAIAPYLDRVRYLKQENLGASVARNTGVKAASGEFIAFLDGDDLWQPNYLREQLKFIRDRKSDLVCADATMFGEPQTEGQSYMTLLMNDAPVSDDVSFRQLIDASRCLITSGIVARRERLIDAGLFDPALRTAQDFDMWLRLALKGARLSYHRQALLKYRCRPDGLTRDAINSHQRELRVFDKIENSYDLSNINRDRALKTVRDRRALLHFELGKLYAARGNFEKARDSFAESRRLEPALKKSVAAWLMRSAPRVMQSICARRV